MKAKVLMTLLLSVLATPALASETVESLFIGPAFQVAQLAPEERRMLRERWEQASPEERMALRRQFQDRLQQLSPDEMARRHRQREQREPWAGRMPLPPNPAEFAGAVGNFGSGYEQRRPPPPNPEDGAANFDPRDRFNPFAGRNRR